MTSEESGKKPTNANAMNGSDHRSAADAVQEGSEELAFISEQAPDGDAKSNTDISDSAGLDAAGVRTRNRDSANDSMPRSVELYRLPTRAEKESEDGLVGSRISLFIRADKKFYPCKILKYVPTKRLHEVVYEEDDTNEVYEEDLSSSKWKVWQGSDAEYELEREKWRSEKERSKQAQKISKKSGASGSGRMSYAAMVVEAVESLADRNGSSIVTIRKYIQKNFLGGSKQQTASFNNLTLKALQNAVALDVLESQGRSYRISAGEKERRKEAARLDKAAARDAAREMTLHAKQREFNQRQRDRSSANRGSSSRDSSGVGGQYGAGSFDPLVATLLGTAAANNKSLRKELISLRDKRDKYLTKRITVLLPFLPVKNYFTRRAARDLAMKKDKEGKKLQQAAIKATAATDATQQEGNNNGATSNSDGSSSDCAGLNNAPVTIVDAAACRSESDQTAHMNTTYSAAVAVEEKSAAGADTEGLEVASVEAQFEGYFGNERAVEGCGVREIAGTEMVSADSEALLLPANADLDEVKICAQSPILKATLHEHQVQGISWMVHMYQRGMPMILGDQMGLGKTIQSIGFLAYLHRSLNKKGPYLIVVPLSVLSNWLSEIEKFCPSFRAVRFHGPKPERERIKSEELRDLRDFDIVVTTYEILVSEATYFKRKYVWTAIIIDEGHRLKNEKSQLSDKLRGIPCLSKVILTGTPLQNNLRELWAMLFYLAPDVFTDSKPFEEGFDLTKGHIDAAVLRRARKLLSIFMLRRLKDNLALSLPSRREVTLLVPLTEQQTSFYRQLICSLDSSTLNAIMNTDSANGAASSATETQQQSQVSGSVMDKDYRQMMNLLLSLRKVCNHTYLLPGIAEQEQDHPGLDEEVVNGSGKLIMMDRMLPMLQQDGHRVLIFSQFTSMLDILEDYCELRDYSYVRLDGETNRVKRRLDVRRFNAPGSPIFIFLISTRAGGLGLNLASADTVILYDSDWNPQVDLQAMERAHRIGQTKPVRVYRLVCRGSVEERMVSRAEKKLFLNAMVAETDPDEQLHEAVEEAAEGGYDEGAAESDGAEAAIAARDARRQQEISQALGVSGGASISKGELASLIRFGANAVFESGAAGSAGEKTDLDDEQLALLLERQGRDLPPPAAAVKAGEEVSSEVVDMKNVDAASSGAVVDEIERFQTALHDRMNKLQEVDLRQLGTDVYPTKVAAAAGSRKRLPGPEQEGFGSELILSGKRARKERITMVDGKGTGYGGAIPVLANAYAEETAAAAASIDGDGATSRRSGRGRSWEHMCFCALCGKNPSIVYPDPAAEAEARKAAKKKKSKTQKAGNKNAKSAQLQAESAADASIGKETPSLPLPIKCAHCPFIFHPQCNPYDASTTRPAGIFICPHHRCMSCDRSTGSAGGLLFRCIDCFAAYCEDCLPQDDIDSVGRCRQLEAMGYDSKQAYFIRCPHCLFLRGNKASGLLATGSSQAAPQLTRVESAVSIRSTGSSGGGGERSAKSSNSATRSNADNAELCDEEAVEEEDRIVEMGLKAAAGSGEEDDEELQESGEYDAADGLADPLPNQLLRICWEEVMLPALPAESDESDATERSKKTKKKNGSSSRSKEGNAEAVEIAGKRHASDAAAEQDAVDPDEVDGDEGPDLLSAAIRTFCEMREQQLKSTKDSAASASGNRKKRKVISASCDDSVLSLPAAIDQLQQHPLLLKLCALKAHLRGHQSKQELPPTSNEAGLVAAAADELDEGALQAVRSEIFGTVHNKISAGRYRSVVLFAGDVRFALSGLLLKSVRSRLRSDRERRRLDKVAAAVSWFLEDDLLPRTSCTN